jgi:hypothetical protein
MLFKKILIVGFFGFFAWATVFCYAASYAGLGVYPNASEWNEQSPLSKSWFIYALEPGEVKNAKVDVINQSSQSVDIKIYPVDAVTTKDGAFAPQPEDAKKTDVGAWVSLPVSELSLGPNETKTIDFTIRVPENVEVGDHMGAIIIQGKEVPAAEEGTTMRVVTRVGARIYLTVPGELIRELELNEFSWKMEEDRAVFYLTLTNKGNIRISPKGEIEIKNKAGKVVDKIAITEREVFPKDTINLPTRWEKTTSGKFTALATIDYGSEENLTKELSFEIVNPQEFQNTLMILGLIIGGIIVLLTIFLVARRKFSFRLIRK